MSEAPRHTLGVTLANNRSPNAGANRFEVLAATRNLLGTGDSTTLRAGRSRGIDDVALMTSIPLTSAETTLELRYEKNTATVIEAPFDALDIHNRSRTVEVGVRHPLHRTRQHSLTLGAALASRTSQTYLGGDGFSFTPGVHDGKSAVGVLRLSLDWLSRSQDRIFSVRGVLNHGLAAFGATRNTGELPDARFQNLLLQLQWVQRLADEGSTLHLRSDLQSSHDRLFSLEKFSLGGIDTVRGFRENQLIRDNGWLVSAEWRRSIARMPLPGFSTETAEGRLSLALFMDAGSAWDHDDHKQALWSLGTGIRWDIARDSFAQVYWAARHKDIPRAGNDLQDRGIHFRMALQRHF